MPRHVNQDERRQRIVAAAASVVTRDGTGRLTMRGVAAEAGVSVGQVQHWFPTKEELLRAAVDDDATRMVAGVDEAIASLGDDATERQRMRTALLHLLPFDAPRRTGVLLRRGLDVTTTGEAAGWWPLADGTLDGIVRPRLLAARNAGELRPLVDLDLEAANLVFFLTGMREHLLAGLVSRSQVTVAVTYLLTRLFRQPARANGARPGPEPGTPGAPTDASQRILRVAERHFAEHGIERASLRGISAEAAQANGTGVQHDVGDRLGLVRAVLAPRRQADEARRNRLLDAYECAGTPDLRTLAEALVLPMAHNLDDPDGGRAYLRIAAEYYLTTPLAEIAHHRLPDTSLPRWHQLLDQLVPAGDPVERTDVVTPRMVATRLALTEISLLAAAEPRPGEHLRVAYIVDVVTGVLRIPGGIL